MIRLSPTAKVSRAAAIRFFAVVLFAVAVAAYALNRRPHSDCRWNGSGSPSYECASGVYLPSERIHCPIGYTSCMIVKEIME